MWTWGWNVEGGEPSTLTVSNNPPLVPVTFFGPDRYFWFADNQVSYYDATMAEKANQVGKPNRRRRNLHIFRHGTVLRGHFLRWHDSPV
jgi:hypothetical protein